MLVIVAPGQGSQTPGFLSPWLELDGYRERLEWLSAAASLDLVAHGTTSDADTIRDTAVAQPLLVAAGLVSLPTLFEDPAGATELVDTWAAVTEPLRAEADTAAGAIRYVAVPLSGGDGPQGVYVVVNFPADDLAEVRQITRIIALVSAGVLVASALVAWSLAGRVVLLHRVLVDGCNLGGEHVPAPHELDERRGAERFAGFRWYGGAYAGNPDLGPATSGNNANSYQLVSVEDVDLLLMHLECNAPDEVLAWAGGVLSAHPDRRAIITTHMWLGPVTEWGDFSYHAIAKGRMQWTKCHRAGGRGNSPQAIWDELVRFHPNVMMVLCGDQRSTQALRMQTVGEEDNIVHEMLSDIRDGYIRLLRFYPMQNRVDVMTFSPTLGMFCDGTEATMSGPRQPIGIVTDITQHQFTLSVNLGSPAPGR